MASTTFRFYAELNNFLSPRYRQRSFSYPLSRDASVKHMIEVLGVPHTEVALILVNGESVDFGYRLEEGDRVSVYPCFTALPAAAISMLPFVGAPCDRFIADAHLGQLAKYLRMLGFDVLYRNDYKDAEVARTAAAEGRAVLTRDRDLLIRKDIVRGCYLHAQAGDDQVVEVILRFDLAVRLRPLTRCLTCNGLLSPVDKESVGCRVPPHSHQAYDRFFQCETCDQVYWEGSHVARMKKRLAGILERTSPPANSRG